MTLVETVLAMALMAVLVTSVGSAVRLLSAQADVMRESTQDIDQLQLAEQAVVQEIHSATPVGTAATPWCGSPPWPSPTPGAPAPSSTPSTELVFTARLKGAVSAYDIKFSGGDLTVATSSAPGLCAGPWGPAVTLATGLAPSSEFTVAGCAQGASCAPLPASPPASWTGGSGATYSFYTSLGVSLTKDSANGVHVSIADNTVDIWNEEELCQADWQIDPQVSPAMKDPC